MVYKLRCLKIAFFEQIHTTSGFINTQINPSIYIYDNPLSLFRRKEFISGTTHLKSAMRYQITNEKC